MKKIDAKTFVLQLGSGIKNFNNILTAVDLQNFDGRSIEKFNLTNLDLSYANLNRSHFPSNLNLSGSIFRNASLVKATLEGTNLSNVDLQNANLTEACLANANLSNADLSNADLTMADLRRANLSNANLNGAKLDSTNLTLANLKGAILDKIELTKALLVGITNPDGSIEETLSKILDKLSQLKKNTWKPIVEELEDNREVSKFGGLPWMDEGQTWFCCKFCQSPMRFFLQIRSQDLPNELKNIFDRDMLQFFYCSNTNCKSNKCFAHSGLVRFIDLNRSSAAIVPPKMAEPIMFKENDDNFSPKIITGWTRIDDYPNYLEREAQEFYLNEYDDDFECDDDEEYNLAHELSVSKDKLSGWIHWCVRVKYIKCPVCRENMDKLVLQLTSNGILPYEWGGGGNGYIVQCPNHPDRISFFSDYA